VIGRSRAAEIQLGLYPSPELRFPDPSMVNLPGENCQRDGPVSNEEDGVAADAPAVLVPEHGRDLIRQVESEPESDEKTEPPPSVVAIQGQRFLADSNGRHQSSPSREFSLVETPEDPAPGNDSGGSAPKSGGEAEKAGSLEKLPRIAASARPFRRARRSSTLDRLADGRVAADGPASDSRHHRGARIGRAKRQVGACDRRRARKDDDNPWQSVTARDEHQKRRPANASIANYYAVQVYNLKSAGVTTMTAIVGFKPVTSSRLRLVPLCRASGRAARKVRPHD
jgi:hypothetical protein